MLLRDHLSKSQVKLYCHSATCVDKQWNEMSCLAGPWCYINKQTWKEPTVYKPICFNIGFDLGSHI